MKTKITESQLRSIIKESLKKVLSENEKYSSMSDFDKMNYDLSKFGDVKVIKNESDDKHIVLLISKEVEPYAMTQIAKYMRTWWGCKVYDIGENGNYKIVTLIRTKRDEAQMDDDFDEYAKDYL